MNKQIIIVNGYPRSGKDTFIKICFDIIDEFNIKNNTSIKYTTRSSIDTIKEIARSIGWDGKKDEKSRKFLSDLKDLLTQFNDFSFNELCEIFNNLDDNTIFFTQVREPNEIMKLKNKFKDNCVTVYIDRDEKEIYNNTGDSNCDKLEYDVVIINNGSIKDLIYKAEEFLNKYLTNGD